MMSRGIIAIGIEEGDELVAGRVTDGKQIIFLASHEGMAVRFDEERCAPDGTRRLWCLRHEPRRERLHRWHGDHHQARCSRHRRRKKSKTEPKS